MGGGVCLGLLIASIPDFGNSREVGSVLTRMLPFLLLYVLFGTLLGWFIVRGARKRYYSYEVTIDDGGVFRTQQGVSELTIRKEEITTLQQVAGKGAMVKTADPSNFLWLLDEIDGYEEVLRRVGEWALVEPKLTAMPGVANQRNSVLITVVLLLGIFLIGNPVAVTALSVLLAGYLAYTVIYSVRNPNCSKGVAIRAAIGVLISVVFIVLRVLTVWTPRP